MPVWFWYQGSTDFLEQVGKYSLLLHLVNLQKSLVLILLQVLIEFTSEVIWARIFLCGKIFDYSSNLFT